MQFDLFQETTTRRHAKRTSKHNAAPSLSSSSSSKSSLFTFPQLPASLPLLTRQEETLLLQKAQEARRINQVLQELTLGGKPLPLPSICAYHAGYYHHDDDDDNNNNKIGDAVAYERARQEGLQARDTLVTRHMGLVYHVVHLIVNNKNGRRKLNSLSADDLVQEGAIGLARAVDKYDGLSHGKSTKFSTYAVYWIRAAVLRCIAERDDLMRVPEHVSTAIGKLQQAAANLGLDLSNLGGTSSSSLLSLSSSSSSSSSSTITHPQTSLAWKEATAAKVLAMEAGLSDKQVDVALKVRSRRQMGGYQSMEEVITRKTATSTTTTTTTQNNNNFVKEDDNSNKEHIQTTLAQFLKPKEVEALSWRYGLLTSNSNSISSTTTTTATRTRNQRNSKSKSNNNLLVLQHSNKKDEEGAEQPEGFRDYEAEAEEAIFGPGGILDESRKEYLQEQQERLLQKKLEEQHRQEQSQPKEKEEEEGKEKDDSSSTSSSFQVIGVTPALPTKTKKSSKITSATTTPTPIQQNNNKNKGGRWGEAMSFAEVGNKMSISAEYGRRLCRGALEKLKRAAEDGQLEPALFYGFAA